MPVLRKVKPRSEKELHELIEKELDALEEGLELLKREFGLRKGTPDFLCVDSGGRLVIIEVKLQEDENMLFQALRYYNEIDKDRYVIAKLFPRKNVGPEQHPRILLIAEKFSDDMRRMTTLVFPDVELYEYTALLTADGKRGICYHPVSLPRIEEIPPKPRGIEDHREYITKDELKPVFDELILEVKAIGKGIEEYATQSYVGFRYKGRQIGWVGPQRKSLIIGAVVIDENGPVVDYPSTRIETGDEDYKEIAHKIRETYQSLGGKAT